MDNQPQVPALPSPGTAVPRTYRAFVKKEHAVAAAKENNFVLYGRSNATGNNLYFVVDALDQMSGRDFTIIQPPKLSEKDSIGIDLPGVGLTRLEDPAPRSGRENAVGGDSSHAVAGPADGVSLNDRLRASIALADASERDERARLFTELVFAAKDLAEAQIEPANAEYRIPGLCGECLEDEQDGVVEHASTCRAGRVLRVIAELIAFESQQSRQKEAAADGDSPDAGDGIRPQGLALQAVDHLLCRIREDARLAYYFDPLGRSMELLTAARAEMCGEEVEAFRARYYPLLRFEAPRCGECGQGGAR